LAPKYTLELTDTPPSLYALSFRSELDYRNADVRVISGDDPVAAYNLMKI